MSLEIKADGFQQIILSDNDVRKFSKELFEKLLRGYNIFEYKDTSMHFSAYIRDFKETRRVLNFVSIKCTYPHLFTYRLRKIKPIQ